jgi:hypothetical protein
MVQNGSFVGSLVFLLLKKGSGVATKTSILEQLRMSSIASSGGPLYSKQNLHPGFTPFRCILSLIQVYIFEIYVKFLISIKPKVWKKMFGPLYSVNPAKNDRSSGGHLTQKFFCYFRYFFIEMNIFRGYFHSKSNFRQKSTHPTVNCHEARAGKGNISLYNKTKIPRKICGVRLFSLLFKHLCSLRSSKFFRPLSLLWSYHSYVIVSCESRQT